MEQMHKHVSAGRATVLLTDLDSKVIMADGTTSRVRGSAGDVLWSGPATHAATNLGPKRLELIIVEVK